jgi:hypothetical protein
MAVKRKTGSVFALGMRAVLLGQNGAPIIGATGAYETDNLVKLDFTMLYREGETKERTNGQGRACLSYEAPTTVRGLQINSLELCNPDEELEAVLGGGVTILDDDDDPVGYGAPEVGVDPSGYGVALELWSNAVHDDGVDDDFPYIRWLFPREKLRNAGTRTVGPDPMAAGFEGSGRQNPNYGDGPMNDWPYISNRVFQWYRTDTIPDLSANAFVPTIADVVAP